MDAQASTQCKGLFCNCHYDPNSLDLYQQKLEKEKQDFINNLEKTPTFECDFKLGDKVTFTNDYGVVFSGLEVTGFASEKNAFNGRFVHISTDCYWFPVAPHSLTKESETAHAH